MQLWQLKHAEDNEGNKQDCFEVLLDFMNYLSKIQAANNAANNAADNENWVCFKKNGYFTLRSGLHIMTQRGRF